MTCSCCSIPPLLLQAARAYDAAARSIRGAAAICNFPETELERRNNQHARAGGANLPPPRAADPSRPQSSRVAARAAVAAAAQSAAAVEEDLCGSPGQDLVPVVTGRPGGRPGTRAAAAAAAQGSDDEDHYEEVAALPRHRGQAAAAAAAVGAAFGGGHGHSPAAAAAALEAHFGHYYQQQRAQEAQKPPQHLQHRQVAHAASLFGASPQLGGMMGCSPKLPGTSPGCHGLLGSSPMLGTSWGNMQLPLPGSLGGSIPGLGALMPELHADFLHAGNHADLHMGSFGMPMSLGSSFPGLPSLPGSLLGNSSKPSKAAPPPGTAAAAAAAAAAGNRAIKESALEALEDEGDDFTRMDGAYGTAGRHADMEYHDEFEDELMAQMDVDDLDHSGSGDLTGCSPETAAVFQELMQPPAWTVA